MTGVNSDACQQAVVEGALVLQRADHARIVARRLAAAGKPVSRRALRSNGVKGSNEALSALARKISAELAPAA